MPPVVFVHGLIGPFADARAISVLRPVTVVCPDLLGYGALTGADHDAITIDAQVDHVRAAVDSVIPETPVTIVGHSVGGVIAMAFAHRFPDRVACVVNVEGNFALADAFWSAKLAGMTPAEVRDLLDSDRADPAGWLRNGGIEPTADRLRSAVQALGYQPATTVRAMARTVVDFTGRSSYESLLRDVFGRTPVHLVAGARSRSGWNVPDWALAAAASYTDIPDCGHMVMMEAPEALGNLIRRLSAAPAA